MHTRGLQQTLLRCVLAECLGVFLLVYIGCSSVVAVTRQRKDAKDTDTFSIAYCFGTTITIMIAIINDISGAHLNPAVTWAMYISRNIDKERAIGYVSGQLIGSVFGAALLWATTSKSLDAVTGVTDVGPDVNVGGAFFVEMMLTFLLVFTIFSIVVRHTAGSRVAPLIIGFCITACHLSSVTQTGTSLNPARSFGPALIYGHWDNQWIYWTAPFVGATFAPLVFYLIYGVAQADEELTFEEKREQIGYQIKAKDSSQANSKAASSMELEPPRSQRGVNVPDGFDEESENLNG